jgi:hypothetical protein
LTNRGLSGNSFDLRPSTFDLRPSTFDRPKEWFDQPFFFMPTPPPGPMCRIKDLVPLRIKQWVRR